MQASNGRADKFSPPANIPQEIALKWADGLAVQSQYNGDQVLFTLTDNRKWYVDPAIATRIHALGLHAGDVFRVTKKEVSRGNRRSIEWEIEGTGADATAPVQATPGAAPQGIPAQTHPNVPTIEGSIRNSLLMTGKLAVEAALSIEGYAREQGMQLQFDAATLQDIWVSAFIQFHRGGMR